MIELVSAVFLIVNCGLTEKRKGSVILSNPHKTNNMSSQYCTVVLPKKANEISSFPILMIQRLTTSLLDIELWSYTSYREKSVILSNRQKTNNMSTLY